MVPSARRIVDIDRIAAAGHAVGKRAGVQQIVPRQLVLADDPAALANADLGGHHRQAAARETGHALLEETQQRHGLAARLNLGARRIVGIQRVEADDPRHVDGDFIAVRPPEQAHELARDVDLAIVERRPPQVPQPGNRRQRVGGLFRGGLVRDLDQGARATGGQ